jgi:hypothetical protein
LWQQACSTTTVPAGAAFQSFAIVGVQGFEAVDFGLETRRDLPGIEELRAAGLLDPVEAVFAGMMEDGEQELGQA